MDRGHFLAQLACRWARPQDDLCRCGEQGRARRACWALSSGLGGQVGQWGPSPPPIAAPVGCGLADPEDKQISTVCPQCVTAVLSRPGCCLRWSWAGPGEAGVPRPQTAAQPSPQPTAGGGSGRLDQHLLCWPAGHVHRGGTQYSVCLGGGETMEKEEGARARRAWGAGWLGTGAGEVGVLGPGRVSPFLSAPRPACARFSALSLSDPAL